MKAIVDEPDAGSTTATSGDSLGSRVRDLRWRLILALGAIQVVPASLALFDRFPDGTEYLVGIGLALAWVAVLRLRRVNRPFLSGFFVGLTAGVVTAAVQGTFVRTYLRHHPELLATNPDASIVAWTASIVGVSLLGGVIAGLVTGTLAWLVDRIGSGRKPPTAT